MNWIEFCRNLETCGSKQFVNNLQVKLGQRERRDGIHELPPGDLSIFFGNIGTISWVPRSWIICIHRQTRERPQRVFHKDFLKLGGNSMCFCWGELNILSLFLILWSPQPLNIYPWGGVMHTDKCSSLLLVLWRQKTWNNEGEACICNFNRRLEMAEYVRGFSPNVAYDAHFLTSCQYFKHSLFNTLGLSFRSYLNPWSSPGIFP